jgi:cell division ATPase FtsA
MSFFSKQTSSDTYGAIIEIGSGSALCAIVHSNKENTHPIVVWSHREHVPLRNIDSLEQVSKSVMTAMISAVMELDSNGRKVLTQYNTKAKISKIQCSISAPWSYTITKTINYTQEEPFLVTKSLIGELKKTISERVQSDLKKDESLAQLKLHTAAITDVEMLSNGYRVLHPEGSKTREFSLSQATVVTQDQITTTLGETIDKVFVNMKHQRLSFMLMAHSVIQNLLPQTYEIGIIDVTYEATEIGVVRDGALRHCTHTPFGSFSLAREIASVLSVSLSEAFGYLHTKVPFSFTETLTESKSKEIDKVFEAYIEKIVTLLNETGDELSIPKTIVLHSDLHSEPVFLSLIEKAVKRTTKSAPTVTLLTKEILKQTYDETSIKEFFTHSSDTALLLSVLFFHNHHDSTAFSYV